MIITGILNLEAYECMFEMLVYSANALDDPLTSPPTGGEYSDVKF
jgi:hypothetical protein